MGTDKSLRRQPGRIFSNEIKLDTAGEVRG